MRQSLVIILIVLLISFPLIIVSFNNVFAISSGFYSDRFNTGQTPFDSLSVQDSTKFDEYGRLIFYQGASTTPLIDFDDVPDNYQVLIDLPGNFYINAHGNAKFRVMEATQGKMILVSPVPGNNYIKFFTNDEQMRFRPGELNSYSGDIFFQCGDRNHIFFQDSTLTNQAKMILDGDDIGWYLSQGVPFKNLTDTSQYWLWGNNGYHLYSNINIMNGDTLLGMDASATDTFMVYDDGDTTRFVSDNPIKIGNSSLIINTDGTVVATGDVEGSDINATNILKLGNIDINTSGTLSNVAYESQENIFTENQTISGGDTLIFIDTTGNDSSLIYDDGSNMVIDSENPVLLANGKLEFPATQSASSNVNILDDYEEGTFTPVVGGSDTSRTLGYTQQTGVYTKIGNRVYFSLRVTIGEPYSAGVGNIRILNLPYTGKSISSFYFVVNCMFENVNIPDTATQIQAYISSSSDYIEFMELKDNTAWNILDYTDTVLQTGTDISISGEYLTQ